MRRGTYSGPINTRSAWTLASCACCDLTEVPADIIRTAISIRRVRDFAISLATFCDSVDGNRNAHRSHSATPCAERSRVLHRDSWAWLAQPEMCQACERRDGVPVDDVSTGPVLKRPSDRSTSLVAAQTDLEATCGALGETAKADRSARNQPAPSH